MINRNLQFLTAMVLMLGGAAVQSAEPVQSGNGETPISGARDTQLAEAPTEYGIRPAETLGSPASPEVVTPGRESSGEASSEIKTAGDIRYVSGGIGESERAELEALSSQFNLRLLFATEGSGEYLSSVQVNVLDTQGAPVLTAESKGPWFLAQLPAGDYSVEVTPTGVRGQDETQRKTFSLDGSGQSRLDFYWKK
ncbi:carboxypeptidase regulatory-like domain-containing protein [Thiocapsa sp.]|uniref:carboxypeptidase regulatory-like domain-containing protein n=1 Tax=Thiocapsa sp. TaxID=2024551 RepID=UPI002C01E089|nr:carboxypeptidase regulatory-like domain-containing protein [Thiocapsa sp.]HSO84728.1 carboxypeptidase regulatory-like domain-containing protein [Thiocapsa sp.]